MSTQGHQWDAVAVISDLRTATSAEGRREEWEEEETNIKKCVLFPFSCMCACVCCACVHMCAVHVCICMLCMCACVCCACVHVCAVHVCMCVLCMYAPVRQRSLSGLMLRIFLDHLSPRAQRYLVLLASLLKDPISPSNLHTLLTFCVWV